MDVEFASVVSTVRFEMIILNRFILIIKGELIVCLWSKILFISLNTVSDNRTFKVNIFVCYHD